MLQHSLDMTEGLRASLCKKAGTDEDEHIAIAITFMMQAQTIFKAIGGPKLSAAQFYGFADKDAIESGEGT